MKKKVVRALISIFCGLLMMTACSEKQDFDQLDDLDITPTYEASIFYVKAQESLINRISGLSFFSQDFNFDAFEEPFFANRVQSGVLTYELENSTSKPIEIRLDFLDENETVLDTETFTMNSAPPMSTFFLEVSYGLTGKSLDIIRNTSKIRLYASNLGGNTSTSNLPDPSIILSSSAKFTLEL